MKTKEIPWEDREVPVTLTNSEWHSLYCYLLMTTRYREEERDGWRKLAERTEPDGMPSFKNAKGNADFWQKQIDIINRVQTAIDVR